MDMPVSNGPTIDPSTTLCLACSASLPPNLYSKTSQTKLHITNCCKRPICPSCIESNSRLARYDPCLMCLQGVDLVGASSSRNAGTLSPRSLIDTGRLDGRNVNLDGALRDEDAFVVDDEGSDDEEESTRGGDDALSTAAPPSYEAPADVDSTNQVTSHTSGPMKQGGNGAESDRSLQTFNMSSLSLPPTPSELDTFESHERKARLTPYKYYLNRSDTLQGLSLRFAVDAREICTLNSLPTSTIRTTPHLLHTRAFLLLPASAKPHSSLELTKEEHDRREREIVRERAERKLQTLTKEADWRVAKAYVAVADLEDRALIGLKSKEEGPSKSKAAGASALALERYLDDEEWEARERRARRTPSDIRGIPPSPYKAETTFTSKSSIEPLASESNNGGWTFFRSGR